VCCASAAVAALLTSQASAATAGMILAMSVHPVDLPAED